VGGGDEHEGTRGIYGGAGFRAGVNQSGKARNRGAMTCKPGGFVEGGSVVGKSYKM